MSATISRQDRFRGALLGLAVGDAVGTAVEFTIPGSFKPINDMIGGGPFELEAGQWTDDTSMALCLASSLIERKGFDPLDQMQRYKRWYEEGYLSSTGMCFDIGGTCLGAITNFALNGNPYAGPTGLRTAGNGSLMRLAPIPMLYAAEPATAIEMAGESSRITHGAPQAVDGCRYYAGLIVSALGSEGKTDLLTPFHAPIDGYWDAHSLHDEIKSVIHDDVSKLAPPKIKGSGYVVKAMEAAMWAFARSENFRDGCLLATNLGDDADTTAAIYGQLAGAHYGVSGIPDSWLNKLTMRDDITALADQLHDLAFSRTV